MRRDSRVVAIERERLIVRTIRVDDAEGFARLVGPSRLSVEGIREKITGIEELAAKGEALLIVIVRKLDGVLMGHCSITRLEVSGIADVGYWMGEEFRGLRYMSEAAPAVIEVAQQMLGVSAFEAVVNAESVASVAVARRMGMELVETVERTVDGRSWTELRFARRG